MVSMITAANRLRPCTGASVDTVLIAGGSAGIQAADLGQARSLAGVGTARMKTGLGYGQIAGGIVFVPQPNPQCTNPQLSHTTRISPDFKGGVGPHPAREPV